MAFEPVVTIKPRPTKPVARPNTRATLRDLNSSRELQVFRRRTFWQRVRQLVERLAGHNR